MEIGLVEASAAVRRCRGAAPPHQVAGFETESPGMFAGNCAARSMACVKMPLMSGDGRQLRAAIRFPLGHTTNTGVPRSTDHDPNRA